MSAYISSPDEAPDSETHPSAPSRAGVKEPHAPRSQHTGAARLLRDQQAPQWPTRRRPEDREDPSRHPKCPRAQGGGSRVTTRAALCILTRAAMQAPRSPEERLQHLLSIARIAEALR